MLLSWVLAKKKVDSDNPDSRMVFVKPSSWSQVEHLSKVQWTPEKIIYVVKKTFILMTAILPSFKLS